MPRLSDVIEAELEAFPEIRAADLEAGIANAADGLDLALIEIRGGRPRAVIAPGINGRTRLFTAFLGYLAQRVRLPDVKLLYNPLDEARVVPGGLETWTTLAPETYLRRASALAALPETLEHPSIFSPLPRPVTGRNLPVLSTARVRGLHLDILVPGDHVLSGHARAGLNDVAWPAKRPTLYWRGSTTGGILRLANWRRFPRIRLACAAVGRRGVDIGITDVIQCEDQATAAQIMDHVGVKPREPFARCFAHRYVYDIEGNSYSSRLAPFLVSGSAVFKPRPAYDEFFFPWLKPGVHYVPMSQDFGDLEAKVEWAQNEDLELRGIAANARRLAQTCLTREFAERYMIELLTQYSARYQDG